MGENLDLGALRDALSSDHEKARQVYQETLVFIDDAGLLLRRLEALND